MCLDYVVLWLGLSDRGQSAWNQPRIQKKFAPAQEYASTLGGNLAGHGETPDGTPVAFVGGACFAQSGMTSPSAMASSSCCI